MKEYMLQQERERKRERERERGEREERENDKAKKERKKGTKEGKNERRKGGKERRKEELTLKKFTLVSNGATQPIELDGMFACLSVCLSVCKQSTSLLSLSIYLFRYLSFYSKGKFVVLSLRKILDYIFNMFF